MKQVDIFDCHYCKQDHDNLPVNRRGIVDYVLCPISGNLINIQ